MSAVSFVKTATPTRKVSLFKDIYRVELSGRYTRQARAEGERAFTVAEAYKLNGYKPLVALGLRNR